MASGSSGDTAWDFKLDGQSAAVRFESKGRGHLHTFYLLVAAQDGTERSRGFEPRPRSWGHRQFVDWLCARADPTVPAKVAEELTDRIMAERPDLFHEDS